VTNAVIDALRPLGVTYIDMPLTPMRIWQAIHTASGPAKTEQGKDVGDHGQGASGSGPASPTEGGAQ
jgi:aerobic carbon-monoxide dehydrogenase large subunit